MLRKVPSPTAVDFQPPFERRPHRVEVDELVGVDDGAVDLHVPAALGVAKVDELLRVLGVVAVELVVAELEDELAAQETSPSRCASASGAGPARAAA